MENNLKTRLVNFIKALLIEDVVKQGLLDSIEKNGLTKELFEKVKFFVDQAIVDYKEEAEKQIVKIRDELTSTLDNIEKEISTIEKQARLEQKNASHKKDEQQLEEVRKTLGQQ